MKVRNEEERRKFLIEQDGWTAFELETVKMFIDEDVAMVRCFKCGHIHTLWDTKLKLMPLHCVGCGRVIMKQDYPKYGLKEKEYE